MNGTHLLLHLALVTALAAAGAGCGGKKPSNHGSGGGMMINPAAGQCVQRGGRLASQPGPGGTTTLCHFPDGSVCEQWALEDGRCAPGQFRR